MKPVVYILQSLKNERYYIGSTQDIETRLKEHNGGLVKATRHLAPLELKTIISCETIVEARKAEYRLKKYKSRRIIDKVIKDSSLPWQYKTGL